MTTGEVAWRRLRTPGVAALIVVPPRRELFIPETQELVKPHESFMLFATQNPPGLYGGRKPLSLAFRNRFLELHVDEIPATEMVQILHKRCIIAPKFCEKMVAVMVDLQKQRQRSQVFAGKHGFITPRDLLRWGHREPGSDTELAQAGYMLLAERLRQDDEKDVVASVLEKHCFGAASSRKLDIEQLYYTDAELPEVCSR